MTYGYDGELLTSIAWSGAIAGTITRTYNSDFVVASETLDGDTVVFDYDDDGLLTQAGDLDVGREAATGHGSKWLLSICMPGGTTWIGMSPPR